MANIKVKKQELLDAEVLEDAIEDKIITTTRWSIVHQVIIPWQGKTYRTTYSVGATEQQDEGPWEYVDEVTLTEVHQVEKTVKVWEPVP